MDNERDNTTQTPTPDVSTADGAQRARLDEFYLARLRRFAGLAAGTDVPAMRGLARHATFSAYRDCVARGLQDGAERVLGGALPTDAESVGESLERLLGADRPPADPRDSLADAA
jgi:hypothetical protein